MTALKNLHAASIAAAVKALLVVAIAFGAHLSGEQVASVVVAVEVISGLFLKNKTTDNRDIVDLEDPEARAAWIMGDDEIDWDTAAEGLEAEDGEEEDGAAE